jgi:hypothetical protein
MNHLDYEIEQLFIDGFSPSRIANILECPLGVVYDWLEANDFGVAVEPRQGVFDPFNTVNS